MSIKKYFFYILPLLILISTQSKAENECFEKTSRAIFKFNMAFDNAILEPVAKGYNKLPEPPPKLVKCVSSGGFNTFTCISVIFIATPYTINRAIE